MESFEDNVAALSSMEPDLQSSAMTGSASDESVSGGGGGGNSNNNGGWLSDFRAIAWSLQQTAGGVANFVHRSAVAIADEIAQLEQEEMEKQHCEGSSFDDQACEGATKVLPLPWELPAVQDDDDDEEEEGDEEEEEEASFVEDSQLKDKILQLGENDAVFLGPFTSKREEDTEFLDEARIALIRRLLQIDDQLARTHARLSGRSDVRETLFWKNYFYHVEQTQASHTALTTSLDSLVPAEEEDNYDDDDWEKDTTAFVQIPKPPASMNSMGSLGVHSVDSMVLIDGPAAKTATAP